MNQQKPNDEITFGIKVPKSISIGAIVALFVQAAYVIWVISSIKHSIDESFNQISRLEQSINKISSDTLGRTEAMLRLSASEDKMKAMRERMDDLNSRIKDLESRR